MTRALQSAAIISRLLVVPLTVEFDLHEWVPDTTYTWDSAEAAQAAYAEMIRLGGEWPPGERRWWEPLSNVRRRVLASFDRFAHLDRVIVVGHGVAMQSLIGRSPELAEICEYQV